MRSSITQFTIKVVVVLGIAIVGIVAISSVVAYSAVERAWTITQETLTKPFRAPVPKAEFRLNEHQKLRKIFLSPATPVL
jgi:hypothetical protein